MFRIKGGVQPQIYKPQIRLKSKFKSNTLNHNNPLLNFIQANYNTMYRPQSQMSRQYFCSQQFRRSTDKKEQSKPKKPTSKQYKQFVRKMIDNTPNHIDSDRRLKIQNPQQANRCEIRQKLEKKMNEDDNHMLRSAVVRFIKPKINDRDYRRFKKLFDIFNKLQKIRNQIRAINCSSTKYIKEGQLIYQNQRLKDLTDQMWKLQKEEEMILVEIQSEEKENRRLFSVNKPGYVKESYLMERNIDTNINDGHDKNDNSEQSDELIETAKKQKNQCSSSHKRKESQMSKKSIPLQSDTTYLMKLYELMGSLKSQMRQHTSPDRKFKQTTSYDSMYEEIKQFMINKHDSIDKLFNQLVALRRINHRDYQFEDNAGKYTDQVHKPYEQVYKSSIKDQFGKFHELDQKAKASTNAQNSQSHKKDKPNSFNFILSLIESDLNELKQMGGVKERNSQLARQLLTVSKQLKKCEEEKISLEKLLRHKKQDDELVHIIKKENELMVKKNQKLDQDNTKLLNEIGRMKEEIERFKGQKYEMKEELEKVSKQSKENSKFEKYYRECLSLQQEVKILSEQNQKLVNQLKQLKQHQQQPTPLSEQKKLIKQKQVSNSSSHQKSAKQSSSLIFKQFQKKNKKLTQENTKLSRQVTEIHQKISQLGKSNQTLIKKMEEMNVQSNRIKDDSKFLEQENNVLLEQNRKIEEEFEYIVKEKLELEANLSNKIKENQKLLNEKENLTGQLRQNLSEMQQTIVQLKQHKLSLMKQLNHLKQAVKQMFQCLNQEITSAFNIFINNFTTQPQQQQSLSPQQKILQSQNQQAVADLTQQCQSLMDELNHCVYELNTYKAMLDQVQIEKELQKKYLQQDILELNGKLTLIDRQNAKLKLEISESNSIKERMQCNEFSNYETQTISPLLNVISHQIDIKCMPQSQQKRDNNLKINCESFSINISPLNLPTLQQNVSTKQQSFQTNQISPSKNLNYFKTTQITIYPDPIQQPAFQQSLTFESWLQQGNFQPQTSTFKSFCEINLTKPSSFLTSHSQNTINVLKQQNQKLKQEIEKLTLNEARSPIKNILSPNDKVYNCFDNTKDEGDGKLRIMGSLYNRFPFPKFQHHQGKEQNFTCKENLDRNNKSDPEQVKEYPPLQQQNKVRQSLAQKFNSLADHQNIRKTNSSVDQINSKNHQQQNNLPTNFQDEDESFDLCIV